MAEVPPCNPQPKSKIRVKSRGKSKLRRKNVKPTKTAGKTLPTLPPFDFEGYLREKDNRNFKLLIDQPEKCLLGGAEEEGGSKTSATTAPYMLIAVKSVAADFDKRQVKLSYMLLIEKINWSIGYDLYCSQSPERGIKCFGSASILTGIFLLLLSIEVD